MDPCAGSPRRDLIVGEDFLLDPGFLREAGSARPRPFRPGWADDKAFAVHTALREMHAAGHAADVCLSALLGRMSRAIGYRAWGHRCLGDYLTEELRQSSVRRLQYLVAIDNAIVRRGLARLGDAWRRGDVGVSRARDLIQVATPENEQEWLDAARTMTSRRLHLEVQRALQRGDAGFGPATARAGAAGDGGAGGSVEPSAEGEPGDEAWRRVIFSATAPVDAAWQVFLETSRRMAGFDAPVHACVDDLLAEYASGCTLLPEEVAAAPPAGGDTNEPGRPEDAGPRERWHHARHATREAGEDLELLRRAGRGARLAADPLAGMKGDAEPDPQDLHMRIRWVLRVRQRIAWHQMRLARVMARSKLYRRLGFGSLATYAEEALDMAPRTVWGLVSLARLLDRYPRVERAFFRGEITALEAIEVCRAARAGTQGDWLTRARTITLQQLREEVAFVVATGDPTGLPPDRPLPAGMDPCAEAPARRSWHGAEGAGGEGGEGLADGAGCEGGEGRTEGAGGGGGEGLAGGAGAAGPDAEGEGQARDAGSGDVGAHRAGGAPSQLPPDQGLHMCAPATSGTTATTASHRADLWHATFGDDPRAAAERVLTPGGRTRPVAFTAPDSLVVNWDLTLRDCRSRLTPLAASPDAMECVSDSQVVGILVLNFLGQWASPQILKTARALRIFARDGWRCQVPRCRSRAHFNAHHIIFRSHNGPDRPWNMITVCRAHHEGLHAGRIAARGRAPDRVTWAMGVNAGRQVRERFLGGTRVESCGSWLAGSRPPSVRSSSDWRAACDEA